VSCRFEELDYSPTPMGDLVLRRRHDPVVDVEVFEVKLGDDFLMSSLFPVAEIVLAQRALALLPDRALDVVVGGLGLGYTATTVLEDTRVQTLLVVERLAPVISWHERTLIPAAVPSSERTRLINEDFFTLAAGDGFDPGTPNRQFDAIVLDIDHSPRHLLSPTHAAFYTPEGTVRLTQHLRPGGVFALWSNDPVDQQYVEILRAVFETVEAEVVAFANPLQARAATNTVYVAQLAP
jgi:spermidine synthase